ncbi:ATPase, T2SS/T4P/T4SS family [Kitasatospora sp. NPDC049285]|uniref:CpaF family protein n=1 Tax=Kitasatospora sp. NPDC049285 TaxID=3157096 RepID=UPI00343CC3FF
MEQQLDHQLVRELHTRFGKRLSEQRRSGVIAATMPLEDERQYAHSVIADVMREYLEEAMAQGRELPSREEEERLVRAVHAAQYSAGPLQPLLDNPDVENINIQGGRVFVKYTGGKKDEVPPLVGSSAELVQLVEQLAVYAGVNSRSWSQTDPLLDIRMPGGERLAAIHPTMTGDRQPALSIRRSSLGKVFLHELQANGTVPEDAAQFLRAAVKARKNIVVAGATDAGKTTLLRALANEIPREERIITIERSLELGLDEYEDLHPDILVLEERLANTEGEGAISQGKLLERSLRHDADRVIVGEVLGGEAIQMLKAMSQGTDGSLSTIHANSSAEVFNRIATYALEAAERLPIEATHMLMASALHFVVFIAKVRDPYTGEKRRRIASIREVNGFDGGRVSSSEVFKLGPDGQLTAAAPISCLDDLAEFDYVPGPVWV